MTDTASSTELPATQTLSPQEAAALLAWYVDMGADETIGETASDRFAPKPQQAAPAPPNQQTASHSNSGQSPASAAAPEPSDAAFQQTRALAHQHAKAAEKLDALEASIADFDAGIDRRLCKKPVIASGPTDAPVMLLVKGPTDPRDDQTGLPFSGEAGVLLDRMLASIGLARETDVRIATLVPWYALGGRDHSDQTNQIYAPFLHRHIALMAPKIILSMGSIPAKTLLDTEATLSRLRGKTHALKIDNQTGTEASAASNDEAGPLTSIALHVTHHPAALIKSPALKAQAWLDLQRFRDHFRDLG